MLRRALLTTTIDEATHESVAATFEEREATQIETNMTIGLDQLGALMAQIVQQWKEFRQLEKEYRLEVERCEEEYRQQQERRAEDRQQWEEEQNSRMRSIVGNRMQSIKSN